ncbi:hypothetical protein EYF80_015907 [Liparis tanakae]|uniref:Uncharacterized protein n=1 Tax=Liparis tanakae TaxID=230148 RepID=A0A4Z2I7R8_9TELE|nr:hypothetical protein EYF80_015907 [Liparis tanakae]
MSISPQSFRQLKLENKPKTSVAKAKPYQDRGSQDTIKSEMSWQGLKGSAIIYDKARVCNQGDTVENNTESVSAVGRQ